MPEAIVAPIPPKPPTTVSTLPTPLTNIPIPVISLPPIESTGPTAATNKADLIIISFVPSSRLLNHPTTSRTSGITSSRRTGTMISPSWIARSINSSFNRVKSPPILSRRVFDIVSAAPCVLFIASARLLKSSSPALITANIAGMARVPKISTIACNFSCCVIGRLSPYSDMIVSASFKSPLSSTISTSRSPNVARN